MARFSRGDKSICAHSNRRTLVGVSAGWHAHLDVLAARLTGAEPEPFWDRLNGLRAEYEKRLPS